MTNPYLDCKYQIVKIQHGDSQFALSAALNRYYTRTYSYERLLNGELSFFGPKDFNMSM